MVFGIVRIIMEHTREQRLEQQKIENSKLQNQINDLRSQINAQRDRNKAQ